MYFGFDSAQVSDRGVRGLIGGRSSRVGGRRLYCDMKFSSAPARSWRRSGQGSNGERAWGWRLDACGCEVVVEVVVDLQPAARKISPTPAIHQTARRFWSTKDTKLHEVFFLVFIRVLSGQKIRVISGCHYSLTLKSGLNPDPGVAGPTGCVALPRRMPSSCSWNAPLSTELGTILAPSSSSLLIAFRKSGRVAT